MNIREIKENKIKTILQFSIPSIIAMLLQTVVTAVIVCIIMSLAVVLLFTPILKVLKADGELSGYFTRYYLIMLVGYPLMVISTILSMFIRMDGKPGVCMIVSMASCILNIIFDYILVGRLTLGVKGSAIASFIVQLLRRQF